VAGLFRAAQAVLIAMAATSLSSCALPRSDKPGSAGDQLTAEEVIEALEQGDGPPMSAWKHVRVLPNKPITVYTEERLAIEGSGKPYRVIKARSAQSASTLWLKLDLQLSGSSQLQWTWRKDLLPDDDDPGKRLRDDAAARLMLAFDGDKTKLPPKEQALLELARAISGEEMPYATLMYSASRAHAPGTVVINPRTERIRTLIVEGGALGSWQHYSRNPYEDFRQVFGEEPGRLMAIGLMTDSDNTQSAARATYGPIRLRR
jgi:hypothetical protein